MSASKRAGHATPTETINGRVVRKAYQFLQLRVQKVGRGISNEILSLHINGRNYKSGVRNLVEFVGMMDNW